MKTQLKVILTLALLFVANCRPTLRQDKQKIGEPSSPGFETTITQRGLSYLSSVGIIALQQILKTIVIPPINGVTGTPIGNIDYSLTNLVITQINLGTSSLTTVPNEGLSLTINGLSVSVQLNWSYKGESWPHIGDSGTADVSASGASASTTIQVTADNLHPVLNVQACSVSLGDLDIELHGGASWLYQIFVNVLHGSIQNNIQNAIQQAITTSINSNVNNILSQLVLRQQLSPEIVVDLGMLSNPTFTSTYLTVDESGEFYYIPNPSECPANVCPPDVLPRSPLNNAMVQMVVGDFVANSAGYAFWLSKQLTITVHDSDIPAWSPIRLNTTSFQYLIPALYQKWPNQLMALTASSSQAPHAVFTTSGAAVTAVGTIQMNVIMPNGDIENAFVLSGSAATQGTAFLTGTTLHGNMTYMNGNFSLASSNIGPFSVDTFSKLLNLLFSSGIVPVVNTYLTQGINLPTVPGLTFVNPSITWASGYLYVSTDINYVPPSSVVMNDLEVLAENARQAIPIVV